MSPNKAYQRGGGEKEEEGGRERRGERGQDESMLVNKVCFLHCALNFSLPIKTIKCSNSWYDYKKE